MTGAAVLKQQRYVLGVAIQSDNSILAKMAFEAHEALDGCVVLTAEEAKEWIAHPGIAAGKLRALTSEES